MSGRPPRLLSALAVLMLLAGPPATAQRSPLPVFTDATASAGIVFTHHNGAAGAKWYPELFGGGVAAIDADTDGWPDLLFVDGRDWTATGRAARHTLYRNNHDGTFRDISVASGLRGLNVYGLGAAVGDFDNDGRQDLFLTTVDGGRLLRNTGGRFTDVTGPAGIMNRGFAVSAAWLDYDKDGRLDLYVGNYVQWSGATDAGCSQAGVKGYCGPNQYRPVAPTLYHNDGAGRFVDATATVGLDTALDKAMGVAVLDYDSDGWPDLFVGSDRVPAKLYRNADGRRFTDVAVGAGVALSENGAARANMGVDAADFDRSGRPHLVVGNFLNEMLGLYRNLGQGRFQDVAPRSEVGRASLLSLTWAVMFADIDLDGFLDIVAINGGTDESQAMDARATLSQPPLLLLNRRDGTFENVSGVVGAAFARPIMGRGGATLDYDGDGDLDLAIGTLAGPAILLRNDGGNRQHWLQVRAAGASSNRDGIGAAVRVTSASGTQSQTVRSGSSYASQSDLTLTFGLGQDPVVTAVDIEWPSGQRQALGRVNADRMILVDEKAGLVPSGRSPGAAVPPR